VCQLETIPSERVLLVASRLHQHPSREREGASKQKPETGHKLPRWKPRSDRYILVGLSDNQASTIPLLLNPRTGSIVTSYNVVFDNWFATVSSSVEKLPDFSGTCCLVIRSFKTFWKRMMRNLQPMAPGQDFATSRPPVPPRLPPHWITPLHHDSFQLHFRHRWRFVPQC
jgi:hypothetical protein